MDTDFELKLVRPRVAEQCNFELTADYSPMIKIGTSIRGSIGKIGILDRHGFLGIYRTRGARNGRRVQRMPFYRPKNPGTTAQQVTRTNFRAASRAWLNLTDSQKSAYNKRAKGTGRTGYNLFIKENI